MSDMPNQRDIDVQIVSDISTLAQNERDFFVLTGSYSIDALTGANVRHNDIDANIFTTNIPTALGRVASLLECLKLTKRTDSRLEYLRPHRYGSTQIEMQFVQYDSFEEQDAGRNFVLPRNGNHEVVIPTVKASLSKTDSYEHIFSVKSLPFTIGAWALRITGVALDQKRKVRESDVRHLSLLVAMPHDRAEVLRTMQHHPQMPDNYRADDVLDMSYEILARRRDV